MNTITKNNWSVKTIFVLILLIILFTINNYSVNAQQANTYVYSTLTGQSLDNMSGASQLIGNGVDDTPTGNQSIGFNFSFEGNGYSNYSVTPDGFMKLGTVTSAEFDNVMLSNSNLPKLCGWWDDVKTGGFLGTGNVRTVLRGTSPNQIRIVQWFVTVPRNTSAIANSNATYQIWIYETTNVIEFRYGAGNNSASSSSTVGLRGSVISPASFISLNTSTHVSSTVTTNNNNTAWPGSGRMYRFTPLPPALCSGLPSPGNTLTTFDPVCAGQSFTLSISNPVSNPMGISYQWQSSPNNSTWTNIGGATSNTLTTTQTTSTWYRLNVTCSGNGTAASTAVQVDQTQCYCTSSATSAADDEIFNVTLQSLNNTSNCSSLAPGAGSVLRQYSNYSQLPAPNISQGVTYPISLTLGYCNGSAYNVSAAVFIDFNRNGIYEASERAFNTPYQSFAVGGSVVSGTIWNCNCT